MRSRPVLLGALPLLLSTVLAAAPGPSFEKDVLPIFTAHCFACHGGTSMIGLDLRTVQSIFKGSHNGPVLVEGDPAESLLYQKVSARQMPPKAFNLDLSQEQIDTIKSWIEAGAPHEKVQPLLSAEQVERFNHQALPVFEAKCLACHGQEPPPGGLDLRTLQGTLKGSENGPVVVEGASELSILIRMVSKGSMPPPGVGSPLTDQEIDSLRAWIDSSRFGPDLISEERETFSLAEAPPITEEDRSFWAFRQPVAAPVPRVRDQGRVRTPIDAFVLARLEAKGLGLSPEESRPTLMRRAYFDLTGLPPTPEEMEKFLSDPRPDAYERLVNRLLESPHYGERWGRHWLDLMGYTDITGFDNDLPITSVFEGMWRYRDWVVEALNRDQPFDRFLTEQLAGDELVDWRSAQEYTPDAVRLLTATGFMRSSMDRTDSDIVNLPGERYSVLFDLVERVSTGVLGLTVGCARCHSHKFDPIPQRDYYRLMAVFTPAYNPMRWKQPKDRFLPDVSRADQEAIERHNAEIDAPQEKLKEKLAALRRPYEEMLLDRKLEQVSDEIRSDVKKAWQTPEEERGEIQKYLAEKFATLLEVKPEEVDKALTGEHKAEGAGFQKKIDTLEGYRRSFNKIQALVDVGSPPVTRLLQRGDIESPGPRVTPGGLAVLSPPGQDSIRKPEETQGATSGYRLGLAKWLASRDHPLTARVMVNRVWYYLLGRGIVATPGNFGRNGSPPTHPQLLDWLAVDFMENGWSLKRLMRMIVTSNVYRQALRQPDGAPGETVDPENLLLWRMNLKRLEAETIRDAILAASGRLDRTLGGTPALLQFDASGLQTVVGEEPHARNPFRRSLYILARRNYPLNFLEAFDYPKITVNCTHRVNSVTPIQSLTLMNDPFLVEESGHLAERVRDLAGESPEERVRMAYLLTLSRQPRPEEIQIGQDHLWKQERNYRFSNTSPEKASEAALSNLCQTLFATNEFLYLE